MSTIEPMIERLRKDIEWCKGREVLTLRLSLDELEKLLAVVEAAEKLDRAVSLYEDEQFEWAVVLEAQASYRRAKAEL